jgi:hypothetical protein
LSLVASSLRKEEAVAKNPCSKLRSPDAPYEIWSNNDGSWKYYVLRKYKSEEGEAKDPYARWYCKTISPATPNGDFGDVYAADIKANFTRIYPSETRSETGKRGPDEQSA